MWHRLTSALAFLRTPIEDQSISFLIETDIYGYRVGMNSFMGLEKQGNLEKRDAI